MSQSRWAQRSGITTTTVTAFPKATTVSLLSTGIKTEKDTFLQALYISVTLLA